MRGGIVPKSHLFTCGFSHVTCWVCEISRALVTNKIQLGQLQPPRTVNVRLSTTPSPWYTERWNGWPQQSLSLRRDIMLQMNTPWQILDFRCFFLHILQKEITSDGMTIQDPESTREKARSLLGQLFNGQFAQLVLGGQFSGGCLPRWLWFLYNKNRARRTFHPTANKLSLVC